MYLLSGIYPPEFAPVSAGTIYSLVMNVYGLKSLLLTVLTRSLKTIAFLLTLNMASLLITFAS
jgi:hypothetical protein